MGFDLLVRSRFASLRLESMGWKEGQRQGCPGRTHQARSGEFSVPLRLSRLSSRRLRTNSFHAITQTNRNPTMILRNRRILTVSGLRDFEISSAVKSSSVDFYSLQTKTEKNEWKKSANLTRRRNNEAVSISCF
jgi:hypothetical protein